MRLLDFFTGAETWGEFWRLLGQLGEGSRYRAAQKNDPEVAEMILDDARRDAEAGITREPEEWHPDPEDWPLTNELLALIFDRLGELAMVVARAKPESKGPDPYPRPNTEVDRARRQIQRVRDEAYDQKLLDVVAKAKQRYREQQEKSREELPGGQ